jgi:hypothetical protein
MNSRIQQELKFLKLYGLKNAVITNIMRIENKAVKLLTPYAIKFNPKTDAAKDKKNILILLEMRYSVSALNRAFDLSGFLSSAGYKATVATPLMSLFYFHKLNNFSAVVFQRNSNTKIVEAYLQETGSRGIPAVYDSDDLLFDPSVAGSININKNSSSSSWKQTAIEHSQVFKKCNYFLTSTIFLADHAAKCGKAGNIFILRNALNKKYIKICNSLSDKVQNNNNDIIIGYMSGTASHNIDFELVENALLYIFNKYRNVYLKIVGTLDLPKSFNNMEIKSRIIKTAGVPFYKLPFAISDFDINIAPSVIGNPFNEGKSELKYVYAGILSIPTIASATDAFRTAIENGGNGFLSYNETDWINNFETLVSDINLRSQTGQRAKEHVLQNYSPEAASIRADAIFKQIIKK